jgi:hypothetical protein
MSVWDIDSDDSITLELQNQFRLYIHSDRLILDGSENGVVLFSKDEVIKLMASLQNALDKTE